MLNPPGAVLIGEISDTGAWAGMTRGTKVVLWRQNDFNSLNNAVFFEGWAGQECPGYLFVHGVRNALATVGADGGCHRYQWPAGAEPSTCTAL